LRDKEFARVEAKPRAGQTPACPSLKTRVWLFWAGLEGLFRIIRQLAGKLIEKLYGYSRKHVKYCTRFSYFRSVGQKSASIGQIHTSKKCSICRKNIRVRQTFDSGVNLRSYSSGLCLNETPRRVLVALVRKLVKFLFPLFGFLVGFSEKRAASQKNIQLFKIVFNRCSDCQAPKLSTRQFSRVSFIPERRDGLGRF
jgi:hypothetical protein